jgi:outer membrane protein OmpA-like peptidoglycan-associated protein
MNSLNTFAKTAMALALAALLTACAGPRSYVALLTSPDGTLGQVTVVGPQGAQVLTQDHTAAALDGKTPPFEVTPKQIQKDFGAALSARPPLPEQFLLYFSQGSELTDESKLVLARLLERAKTRTSLDISVIGHTDTQGASAANQALALERANAMAEQLRGLGLQDAVMAVESHGERNLLVPTADEVAEPRNRRVEITLR